MWHNMLIITLACCVALYFSMSTDGERSISLCNTKPPHTVLCVQENNETDICWRVAGFPNGVPRTSSPMKVDLKSGLQQVDSEAEHSNWELVSPFADSDPASSQTTKASRRIFTLVHERIETTSNKGPSYRDIAEDRPYYGKNESYQNRPWPASVSSPMKPPHSE